MEGMYFMIRLKMINTDDIYMKVHIAYRYFFFKCSSMMKKKQSDDIHGIHTIQRHNYIISGPFITIFKNT